MLSLRAPSLAMILGVALVACSAEPGDDPQDAGADSADTSDAQGDAADDAIDAVDDAIDGSGADDADANADAATDVPTDTDAGEPVCFLAADDVDPDYTPQIGCYADYAAVASPPLVASIPGALSAKTVIDRADSNALYFQNSRRFPIHWNFASTNLSGNGLPLVPQLGQFNQTEYYAPDRRFVLGAVNYFEGPAVWAYEIAPYDTASAEMIELAFDAIRDAHYAGDELYFHPTSDTVALQAELLPDDIPIITTDELYAGIDYQPLNLATSVGRLRFFTAAQVETEYLSFRDIAVLEAIPNDISVCGGTITAEFQTPLSHINILSQNRGTPNMGLRNAFENPELRALEDRWVELTVGPSTYSIREVTQEEADAWWEANRPAPLGVPRIDLTVTDLRDIEDVLDVDGLGLDAALDAALPAFGGKASHYAGFPHITTFDIPYPPAFVVPIYYYHQFMQQNGLDVMLDQMLDDPEFRADPATRERMLEELRQAIFTAPIDPAFEALLLDKLNTDFPGTRMKFRSSTNAEDLDGFTGAGLYESASGDPNDPSRPVMRAVRTVWASPWRFRAFEEREYRGISQRDVGMAVLVNTSFSNEDCNGVAITANIFDSLGVEPGFYINVQAGETSVVLPPEGITSDQFVYHYDLPGQPIVYLDHSNLMPPGTSVLDRAQVEELGQALAAIHNFYSPVYGPNTPDNFYAMDVEFKFDTGPDGVTRLVIKQARPYPGRGE